jgi:hypothetical protein
MHHLVFEFKRKRKFVKKKLVELITLEAYNRKIKFSLHMMIALFKLHANQ